MLGVTPFERLWSMEANRRRKRYTGKNPAGRGVMQLNLKKSTRTIISVILLLYGAYLTKTLLGINISGRHSASWILKAPIDPLYNKKDEFCMELQSACQWRRTIRNKVQKKIEQAKDIV